MNKIHKFLRTRMSPFGAPLLAIMMFFGITQGTQAQVANYTFAATLGTYTPITGGTVHAATTTAASAPVDDANYDVTIPFTFTFNGVAYTSVTVNSNGLLQFGPFAATAGFYPPLSTVPTAGTTYVGSVVALGRDLEQRATTPFGELRSEVIGVAPNRIFVAQYKDWAEYPQGTTQLDTYNFQIRLLENGNKAEIVYGAFTVGTVANPGTPPQQAITDPEVGLGGAVLTDFNNRTGTWGGATNVAGTVNTATLVLTATAKPAVGQTYTWTPPVPCTGVPVSSNVTSSVVDACVNSPFTLSLSASNVGNTFQWQSSPLPIVATPSSFSNIVGAVNSTYVATQATARAYRCIITCPTVTPVVSITSNSLTMNMIVNTIGCYRPAPHPNIPVAPAVNPCISNVTFGAINNNTTVCALPLYTAFANTITTNLVLGATVPLTVTVDAASINAIVSVWIDWNADGDFAANEWLQVFAGIAAAPGPPPIPATPLVTGTVSVVVPTTAKLGLTKMRVRSRAAGNINDATVAYTPFGSGESEDYFVTITNPVGCTSIFVGPTPGAPLALTTGTGIAPVLLSAAGGPVTPPAVVYTYSAGVGANALPAGLSLSTVAGVTSIIGTPTGTVAIPNGTFTISATSGICVGPPTTYSYSLTVPVACNVVLSPASGVRTYTVGTQVNVPLIVTPAGAYVYTSTALPAGLQISSIGGITSLNGTPTTATTAAVNTFTITATLGTCSATNTYTYTTGVNCGTIVVTPSAGSAGALVIGTPVSITLGASGAGTTYTYAVTAGALPAGVTLAGNLISGTPTTELLTGGTFTITASATSVGFNTCTQAKVYTFTVGKNLATAIDNALSSKVSVSPNPSKSEFNVDFGGLALGKAVVRVYDAQGKQVFTSDVTTNAMVISLGKLANGIYLMEVETAKGRILKRLAKQ